MASYQSLTQSTESFTECGEFVTVDDVDKPEAMIVRIASGRPNQNDLLRLQLAAKNWLDSNGKISFERCLHLPCSPYGFRLTRRDKALCDAAALLPERTGWTAATRMEREWNDFLERGPWRFWRGDSDPPADAAPLSRAFFYATNNNRSDSLSAKQIQRSIGHLYR